MAFSDIEAKTTITGFTDDQKTSILADLKKAYEGSEIAKKMFDDWIATAGHTIDIKYVAGKYQAWTSTGRVEIDPAYLSDASYINDKGTPILDSQLTALTHELGHALTGRRDNISAVDYQGDNVRYVNTIWNQLGLEKQISYVAYARNTIHKVGYTYTNGAAIDAARSGDIDMSLTALNVSNDLLIGGPSANILQSGGGNDFLFGAGGDDRLLGGAGTDTAVYFGSPLDYDIRLTADGTWSVKNVRGAKDAGLDILKNIEKVQFDATGGGHIAYELKKGGLSYQTDFALVIDRSGSMGDDIDSVKAVSTSLVNAAFGDGTKDARIGAVTFSDTEYGEPTNVVLQFTDQDDFAERKSAAIAAINGIGLDWGGDEPEVAFDGLLKALDGSMGEWRAGAGIKRIALFTDAPAKDSSLADQVTALAHNIGFSVGSRSTLSGVGGSVDTFSLTFEGDSSLPAARAFPDDPEADELPPFEMTEEAVDPDPTTTQVQIFTIVTGTPYWDTYAFESISSGNAGQFLSAPDNDTLVDLLFDIVEGKVPGNNPPTDMTLSANVIAENAVLGQIVGSLSTTDADAGETFVYSLINNSEQLFGVNGVDLVVSGALDFEAASSHDITVQVTDSGGNAYVKTFTVDVTNIVGVTIAGTDTTDVIDAVHTILGQPLPTGEEDAITGLGGDDFISGLGGNDTIDGGSGNDTLKGGTGNDMVAGGTGNDIFIYQSGNDTLNGGAGQDTAVLPMFPDVYSLVQEAPGRIRGTYADYTLTLEDVEFVQFGTYFQTTLAVGDLASGQAKLQLGRLTDLYLAFFGRAPDVSGLEYWQERLMEEGRDFATISKDFAWSDEAQRLFPRDASNREFVQAIYQNCFDRDPDTGGWDYWTQRLDALGSTDLNDRGSFVGELILGAYAVTSGEEDRGLLTHKHEVAMHYVNRLSEQPEEEFDASINDLLELVTGDSGTQSKAEAVIDHVFEDPITLTGVMNDPALLESIWSAA